MRVDQFIDLSAALQLEKSEALLPQQANAGADRGEGPAGRAEVTT